MNARGFSLLETMVALAIFSMAATGLVSAATQSVRASAALEERLLAQTVANNVAVDTASARIASLDVNAAGEEIQRRQTFTWTRTIEATTRSELYSVRIDVRRTGETEVLARLSFLTRSGDGR
jgi:general secretion pathway protein I